MTDAAIRHSNVEPAEAALGEVERHTLDEAG